MRDRAIQEKYGIARNFVLLELTDSRGSGGYHGNIETKVSRRNQRYQEGGQALDPRRGSSPSTDVGAYSSGIGMVPVSSYGPTCRHSTFGMIQMVAGSVRAYSLREIERDIGV